MAKGKGGNRGVSSGLRKSHGPKRHMFKDLKPLVHLIAKTGLLSKYYDFESWVLACQARGIKNPGKAEFSKFVVLPTIKAKNEFFAALRK